MRVLPILVVAATGRTAAVAAAAAALLTSIKGWYRLGANGTDTSGQSNDLTMTAPTYAGGKLTAGSGVKTGAMTGATSWSISGWYSGAEVLGFGNGPGVYVEATKNYGLRSESDLVNVLATAVAESETQSGVIANAEHHFAATFASGVLKVYVDGSLANTGAGDAGTYGDFTILSNDAWQGSIRMVGVWANRVLSSGDVTTLYGGGTPYDPTA